MNAESSRSHLVLGVILESTNLGTGAVVKGKLTLVDLAGSERSAKTGATAEQLKVCLNYQMIICFFSLELQFCVIAERLKCVILSYMYLHVLLTLCNKIADILN